jgi:putative transposase
MLTNKEMMNHLRSLNIPKEGIEYVMYIRSHPPERQVKANFMLNSTIRYASQNMSHAIQGEGATSEGYHLLEYEYDRKHVLEVWDQIKSIIIEDTRKDGRHLRTSYTPDHLVIRDDKVKVVEPRNEETLQKLCRERPTQWCFRDGEFHWLQAEARFAQMGIEYQVISTSTFNAIRAENLHLLIHSRRTDLGSRFNKRRKLALGILQRERVQTLKDLSKSLRITDLTPILRWIDDGYILADLNATRLSLPEAAYLALQEDDLVTFISARKVYVIDALETDVVTAKDCLKPKHAIQWMKRIQELKGEVPRTTPQRTFSAWKKALRDANGDYNAVKPAYANSGNREEKITRKHIKYVKNVIKKYYAKSKRPSERGSYRHYKLKLSETKRTDLGKDPIAFNSYKIIRKSMNQMKIAQERGGRRFANAAAPPTDPRLRTLPASRPFQHVYIDHHLCKSWIIVARTVKMLYCSRAWLTLMWDEYASYALAMALNFCDPSRRSLAAVLRDCVRRHQRLGEWNHVDQGADFRSVYFEGFLADAGAHKQECPSGAPRFHGGHERVFGITNTELISETPGNVAKKFEARSISSSHHGRNTAEMSLYDLYMRLQKYYFDQYNTHAHGQNRVAPNLLFEEGIKQFGCSGIMQNYDYELLVKTAIPASDERYRLDPTRGVKIHDRFYRAPALMASNAKYIYRPRIEPWDNNRIYVCPDKRWITAFHGPPSATAGGNSLVTMCDAICHYEGRVAIAAAKNDRDLDLARNVGEMDRVEKRRHKREKQTATQQRRAKSKKRWIRQTRKPIQPFTMVPRSAI